MEWVTEATVKLDLKLHLSGESPKPHELSLALSFLHFICGCGSRHHSGRINSF